MRAIHLIENIGIMTERKRVARPFAPGLKQTIAQLAGFAQFSLVKLCLHPGKRCQTAFILRNFGSVARIIPFAIIGIPDAAIGL